MTKIKKHYYASRHPEYNTYVGVAETYLEMEAKLKKLQAQEKKLKRRIYAVTNEMSRFSANKLGLLGHRVVDQIRKERKEAAKSRRDAKNNANSGNVPNTPKNDTG